MKKIALIALTLVSLNSFADKICTAFCVSKSTERHADYTNESVHVVPVLFRAPTAWSTRTGKEVVNSKAAEQAASKKCSEAGSKYKLQSDLSVYNGEISTYGSAKIKDFNCI